MQLMLEANAKATLWLFGPLVDRESWKAFEKVVLEFEKVTWKKFKKKVNMGVENDGSNDYKHVKTT